MHNRRNFLTAAAGIMFCGCEFAPARAQAPPRKPLVLNGKRLKTIDAHAHCLVQDSAALLPPAEAAALIQPIPGAQDAYIVVEKRLAAMDAMGIDVEVLSINPFWYAKERDLAGEIVRINNERLAELCAAHPDRFAAFGSLTLQAPDLAVQELETAVRKQGLKGAAIGGSVSGVDFSDPRFHPVWAKAEELGAVLFIHPQRLPDLAKRFKGNGWLDNTIGNPLDTTIALSHLIFDGTLDRFPGLKVLASHGGGYLPSYADRSDHTCATAPAYCDASITLKKKPSEYLKQIYYDALVFTPEALRHLIAEVGASQLVLGTDFPYPWELHPVESILACDFLSAHDKAAIIGTNAAKLLKL